MGHPLPDSERFCADAGCPTMLCYPAVALRPRPPERVGYRLRLSGTLGESSPPEPMLLASPNILVVWPSSVRWEL